MDDDNCLRPGDRVVFSKTVLESLLATVRDRADVPEGAVSIETEFTGALRYPDGGPVALGFKRI